MTSVSETAESIVKMPQRDVGIASEAVRIGAEELGFAVAVGSGGSLRLIRQYRPRWATVLGFLTLPVLGVGLLFFLVKRTDDAVVTIFEDREGTKARIVGSAPPALGEMLAGDDSSTAGMIEVVGLAVPETGSALSELVTEVPAALTQPPDSAWETVARVESADCVAESATVARDELQSPSPSLVSTVPAVVLPDGRREGVGAGVLIGRDPSTPAGWPELRPVIVADPSVSKTHCAIAVSGAGVQIADLHSTNGCRIRLSGVDQPVMPGSWTAVPDGAQAVVGDLVIEFDRGRK